MNSVLDDLVLNFKIKAQEKGVEVQLITQVDPAMIVSDELRFRQIITNILSNALKFTTHGTVKIQAARDDAGKIKISIEDTGLGISDEDAAKLFQPFAQAESPLRRRYGGTGLGLVISRKLAHLLGGELILATSRVGVGSVFVLTIEDSMQEAPAETATDRSALKKPRTSATPNLERARILVAEDSPDNQTLLRHYLASTKVVTVFANNGLEAKALALSEHFDLILMDIQMPEMDGFEATAALREAGWARPIVAFTAHALQPERARAMAGGFDDYLVKPIAKAALWQALERHLPKDLQS
ncbi:MAG: response regulator [Proteobacteria bacterium]|nr:MAG: response regulator [Pseudomonadota bacterium]